MKWTLFLALLCSASLFELKSLNIFLIYADDLVYGDDQAYHPESKIPTPQINRLAEAGMIFRDGHSVSTVCTPSCYAVMTGCLPFRTGFRGVFKGVDLYDQYPEKVAHFKSLLEHIRNSGRSR